MSKDSRQNLKKLSRAELLEMLIAEEKRIDQLEKELEEAREALKDRAIKIENAGSIAEAALKLSGIFEAAQAAVDQYVENIEQITRQRAEAGREED
ncbi:DNA repair protein [Blautia sp. HCP3S3_G3]|uniref:DNA repair protein n=1 Tax=Blautia sp. HCP3S3_G3 TaxID=3438913 RepID=UPI003F8903AF